MAQIDKLNYLPLLCWFLVLFILLYFYLFTQILPLVFSALHTRGLFFRDLLREASLVSNFFFFLCFCAKDLVFFRFIFLLLISFFFLGIFSFKVNVSTFFIA